MPDRRYPHGRLNPDDEGEIAFRIASDKQHGVVIIDFGKPVTWIGLPPAEIAQLVKMLIRKAREVATEPFSVEL